MLLLLAAELTVLFSKRVLLGVVGVAGFKRGIGLRIECGCIRGRMISDGEAIGEGIASGGGGAKTGGCCCSCSCWY